MFKVIHKQFIQLDRVEYSVLFVISGNFQVPTLWIDFSCNFQSIRISKISVCWSDSKDQAVGFRDELQEHVSYLHLDILGLVAHSYLGHTRQIN